jgi:hypothetical protein
MIGRRTIVGLCMLCALVFSALAAQGAAAATNGTTSFTCKAVGEGPIGTKGFKDEHCKEPTENVAGQLSNVKFEHVAIAENITTEATTTNAKTGPETKTATTAQYAEIIGGVEVEVQSTEITGSGTLHNVLDASGEHTYTGEGTLTLSNITVTKPAGKGCVLRAKQEGEIGMVTTEKMTATSKGQGDRIKLAPSGATPFATFWLECTVIKVPAIEGTWEVTGSLTCPTEGATLVCTHTDVTTQGTLKGRALKVMGIQGKLTLTAKDKEIVGDVYRPISVTTVSTP